MWISPKIFFSVFFLKSLLCCDCSGKSKGNKVKNHVSNDVVSKHNGTNTANLEKRQLEFEEEFVTDIAMEISTLGTESVTTESVTGMESVTESESVAVDTSMPPTRQTSTDNKVQTTEVNVADDKLKKCPYYKNGAEFDLNVMADVWENAYYQMKQKLSCFRIHLKLVTREEQKYYEKIYGNFNNVVQWEKCMLEVKSGPKRNVQTMKHFLQGTASNKGVMDNIIILEKYDDKTTTITLREENPDQWLLIKDLLLMRDCDDGDLVVFARVPFQPRLEDVMDALATFGENKPNGTFGCVGNDVKSSVVGADSDEIFK